MSRKVASDRAFDPFAAAVVAFCDREGIPRLGTPWEAVVPAEKLFDSPYHLTCEAADEAAPVLAAELKGSGLLPRRIATAR